MRLRPFIISRRGGVLAAFDRFSPPARRRRRAQPYTGVPFETDAPSVAQALKDAGYSRLEAQTYYERWIDDGGDVDEMPPEDLFPSQVDPPGDV